MIYVIAQDCVEQRPTRSFVVVVECDTLPQANGIKFRLDSNRNLDHIRLSETIPLWRPDDSVLYVSPHWVLTQRKQA